MNEIDIGELEDEYEERILMEFAKVVDDFQKKNAMNDISMIRLLLEQTMRFINKIEIN